MHYLYLKRIVLSTLLIITTLEMTAQSSPRFSFTSEVITLDVLNNSKNTPFKVYKGDYTSVSQTLNKHAILGDFTQSATEIRFTPILPFQKNTSYTVVFANKVYPFIINLNPLYDRIYVETLYPNSDTLPSNFLKWYIRFSKPVNPSKIYDHISLIRNSDSTKVDRALLPLETPLLSSDHTLFTLWIEPGRQKRDLGPNKRLGEVLSPNESYTLVIDKNIKDSHGITMETDYTHSFSISTPDRIQPSIITWKINAPFSNTKGDLSINYTDLLDYGSLYNTIQILNSSGDLIEGEFAIEANQRNITFKPVKHWIKGDYILQCKPIIEDIAGNNLERLFDQDITVKSPTAIVELSFRIE